MCDRHKYFTAGWSQKSALRTSLELWSYQALDKESLVLPATQAITTATTPPACPAHLDHTLMALLVTFSDASIKNVEVQIFVLFRFVREMPVNIFFQMTPKR